MKNSFQEAANEFGLLALGSCGAWQIDIDEALKGAESYFVQIQGPSVYLYFQLLNLSVIDQTIKFLQTHTCVRAKSQKTLPDEASDALTIGSFGRTAVSLIWDNEYEDRCFFVVGAKSRSCMRLCFFREDMSSLVEALRQIGEDLAENE